MTSMHLMCEKLRSPFVYLVKMHFILELDQDFDKVSNTLTRANVSVCQLLVESKQSMFLIYLFSY